MADKPVSVLVNNAGITRDTLLMRMKEEDWDSVINTNLKSVYKLSQAVIKGMMKNNKLLKLMSNEACNI